MHVHMLYVDVWERVCARVCTCVHVQVSIHSFPVRLTCLSPCRCARGARGARGALVAAVATTAHGGRGATHLCVAAEVGA